MNLEQAVLAANTQSEIDALHTYAKKEHSRSYLYFNLFNISLVLCFVCYISGYINGWIMLGSLLVCALLDFRLISNLQPVWWAAPLDSTLCKEALEMVNTSESANAYRNEVVAKGIQFTYSHYKQLKNIYETELNTQPCKELHLIAN